MVDCNDLVAIGNNDDYCTIKDKTNAAIQFCKERCEAGLRLEVIGSIVDNQNVFDTTVFATLSGAVIDPLSGFSASQTYTIQNGDDGIFDIIAQVGTIFQSVAPTTLEVRIYIDGVTRAAISMANVNASTQWRPQIVTTIPLVAGQTIEVVLSSQGGNAADANIVGIQNSLIIYKR